MLVLQALGQGLRVASPEGPQAFGRIDVSFHLVPWVAQGCAIRGTRLCHTWHKSVSYVAQVRTMLCGEGGAGDNVQRKFGEQAEGTAAVAGVTAKAALDI